MKNVLLMLLSGRGESYCIRSTPARRSPSTAVISIRTRGEQISAKPAVSQSFRRGRERVFPQIRVQSDKVRGALPYWAADAIRSRYVKNGMLV
jgi:hypothetical protein